MAYIKITEGLADDDYIGLYNRVRKGAFFYKGKVIQVRCFPNGFWNKETAKILVRYLILDELKWTREDICKNLTNNFLQKHNLRGVVKVYNASSYKIVTECFPEMEIKPWELSCCPNGFWSSKVHCKQVTKWIAKKENIHRDKKKFAQTISSELYEKYGVYKAVQRMGGLYEIVNYTYPGRYRPWQLNKMSVITDEIVVEATKWLIEDKLKWSFKDVCDNLTAKTFYDNNVGSILCKGCGHSPIIALEKTYPGVYKKEMLKKGMEHPFREKKEN